jgi:simple sugar transport system ATP-binding protein
MPILEMRGVSKHFGAIVALDDVYLALEGGQVLGLMGDNGAGKSTMVKIIAGNFPPSSGTIVVDGEQVAFRKPLDARTKGIEIVYQDLALCNNLTAAANVFLGREVMRSLGALAWLDHRGMARRAGELFADAKVVLMDEPTAAISVRQVVEVLELIRKLKSAGVAVVLISHRMPDVFAVCDRVAVMRRGRKVADKAIRQSSPEEVTGLITGAIREA